MFSTGGGLNAWYGMIAPAGAFTQSDKAPSPGQTRHRRNLVGELRGTREGLRGTGGRPHGAPSTKTALNSVLSEYVAEAQDFCTTGRRPTTQRTLPVGPEPNLLSFFLRL
jgi:hypothetical protein